MHNASLFWARSELRVSNRTGLFKARATGATKLSIDVHINVAGIPAGAHIISYTGAKPWKQHTFPGAGPGDCDPPEYEEVEYEVLDSKGYLAPWLVDKINKLNLDDEITRQVLEGRSDDY